MCNAIQQRLIEERLVEEEVYEAMVRMRHRINEVIGLPSPVSPYTAQQSSSYDSPEQADGNKARPPRRSGHSREWDYVYGDGKVPTPKRTDGPVRTDVMAVGDVERDPTAPIAPWIPPTEPQGEGNPFPMLNGPMG